MSVTKRKKNPIFDPGLCRCCGAMSKCRVLTEKYEFMGRKEVYANMIKHCFGFELSLLDGLQSECLVCAPCVSQLRQAFTFKALVLQSEHAFLQSRVSTHSGPKIQLKAGAEIGFIKAETEGLDDFSVEDGYDAMSDGLDDDIDPELLSEYNSLESICKEMNSNEITPLKNLKREPKKQYNNTRITHRIEPNNLDGYSSPNNDFTAEGIDTNIRKETAPLTEQSDQPFMQAANVTSIVKYSYACPFKNRFNHILCYYCDVYFLNPVLLRAHMTMHNPKDFKATRNRYTKLDLTRIDCRLCPEKIDNLEDFKRHLVTRHGKNYFPESKDCVLPFKLVENVNKCTLCNEEFSYFYGLHKHMNQHFSNYMCETCGMGFMDEISLQKHVPTHDGKRYPCDTCGNTFKSEYTRLCHVQRIHNADIVGAFCSLCDAFLARRDRARHMAQAHAARAALPCLGCDRVFSSRRLLTIHVRREHMKDYRYECHVCHKKFFRRSALTFHMPTHTGERNFKCKVCEKSYPRLKTLKEHMKIHNNDRRYRCHICGQAFVQNCSLKGHMKSKHPEYG